MFFYVRLYSSQLTDNRPIGIFDSGIGGLTVAHALNRALPHESILYFGDTAHLPYGDKSKASIRQYSQKITEYLIEKNCKAVIVACNTASAFGYDSVVNATKGRLTFNVIDPIVDFLSEDNSIKKVGVIGTKGTMASRVYPNRIKVKSSEIKVVTQATPLLAPMIEEGFYNNNISQTIINSYLSKKAFENIDALVLGCTHYPLIKQEVENFLPKNVFVLDAAEIVAMHVSSSLKKEGLLGGKNKQPTLRFVVSDYTESFERSTRIFFGEKLHLEEDRIWD